MVDCLRRADREKQLTNQTAAKKYSIFKYESFAVAKKTWTEYTQTEVISPTTNGRKSFPFKISAIKPLVPTSRSRNVRKEISPDGSVQFENSRGDSTYYT